MAKVIDIGAIREERESQREDWHGRKLSQAELDALSWEEKCEIVDRTIITIPIATPQMWADFSGVPKETFMKWKYTTDMQRFGRVLKSNLGHNI